MSEVVPKCPHWEGDTIQGYWLCAKCYAKLDERPRVYRMVDSDAGGDIPPRQQVTYAPIATADETTLSQFIDHMALRLVALTRGGFNKDDAIDYAVDILRTFGEPFGSADLDWSQAGAWDLVDEDLQYWDADGAASN